MYTFPGNVMADGGAENKQSAERTSTERPVQLMSSHLREVVQLREVDSTSIEVSVHSLNEKTDSQLSLRLVVYRGQSWIG